MQTDTPAAVLRHAQATCQARAHATRRDVVEQYTADGYTANMVCGYADDTFIVYTQSLDESYEKKREREKKRSPWIPSVGNKEMMLGALAVLIAKAFVR